MMFAEANYRLLFRSFHPDGTVEKGGMHVLDAAVKEFMGSLTIKEIVSKSKKYAKIWEKTDKTGCKFRAQFGIYDGKDFIHLYLNPRSAKKVFPEVNEAFTTYVVQEFICKIFTTADKLSKNDKKLKVEILEKAIGSVSKK